MAIDCFIKDNCMLCKIHGIVIKLLQTHILNSTNISVRLHYHTMVRITRTLLMNLNICTLHKINMASGKL